MSWKNALVAERLDAAILPPSVAVRAAFDPQRLGRSQLIVPAMTMSGGTALTVSVALYDQLVDTNRDAMAAARPTTADAIAYKINGGGRKLRLGVTRRYSFDEYKLRYWLASSGINPDTQVEIVEQTGPTWSRRCGRGQLTGSWRPSLGQATRYQRASPRADHRPRNLGQCPQRGL